MGAVALAVFQDDLFSNARVVERTLPSGTVLRLKLEPLPGPGEQVKVLEYHRRVPGGLWQRHPEEEGRTLAYAQLKLEQPFGVLFAGVRSRG